MVASLLGHAEVIGRLLLEDDVNIYIYIIEMITIREALCGVYASRSGRVEAVGLLFGAGASTDMCDVYGRSPLSRAG